MKKIFFFILQCVVLFIYTNAFSNEESLFIVITKSDAYELWVFIKPKLQTIKQIINLFKLTEFKWQ